MTTDKYQMAVTRNTLKRETNKDINASSGMQFNSDQKRDETNRTT